MRLAKTKEIEISEKQHAQLAEKIPVEIRSAYNQLVHTIKIRQDQVGQKKLQFLARNAQITIETNSGVKNLHSHLTPVGFPPQVNNKVLVLSEQERRILNFGPKFVPSNPKQALDRLDSEISVMKDKVGEVWRRETRTVGRNPLLVEQFAHRLSDELRNRISQETVGDKEIERTLKHFQTSR